MFGQFGIYCPLFLSETRRLNLKPTRPKDTEIRTFLELNVRFRKPVVQLCYADLAQLDVEISIQAKMADLSGAANWLLDINQPHIGRARTFL